MANDQKIKKDEGKLRLSLVPVGIIKAIARVRMFGVKKYGSDENWKEVEKGRYIDAMLRHILAYVEGKEVDEESGLPPLWHVACNVAFLIDLEDKKIPEPVWQKENTEIKLKNGWAF